ncbi:MAG: helix-turn-helix domain-containing protein [Methylobacteriaceae bacterium]|nr:helix-turn-helix domain-containing protein [Methylobacteriaceae bacterium]
MRSDNFGSTLAITLNPEQLAQLAKLIANDLASRQVAAQSDVERADGPASVLEAIEPAQLYRFKEAAAILRKAESTLWRWRSQGSLETVAVGHSTLISGSELRRLAGGGVIG